jgi:hypothetical protein
VVVEKIDVHVVPSGDVWIWNDLPNAVSHCRTTWQIGCDEPRSTWIHCGSLNALDQRVPALPSTAFEAGKLAFSVDDALAGLPTATFVVPQPAAEAGDAVPTDTGPASSSSDALARRSLAVLEKRPNKLAAKAGCMSSPLT